jgi:putative transposase
MPNDVVRYPRYRFPAAIIRHAVWLYYRFTLSFRDVEDLLAHRGITVSYEFIRHWCETFGLAYARGLRQRAGPVGDTWHLDELFVTIRGERQYLWRGVDQDGDVIDILLQPRRHRHAAARFFRKLLKRRGRVPHRLVTDRLGSYRAAHRVIMPSVVHDTTRYANNRAEVSHQPTRQRERHMRRFKSVAHAQRFSRSTMPFATCSHCWTTSTSRQPSAPSALARVRYVERRGSGLIGSTPRQRPTCALVAVNLTVPYWDVGEEIDGASSW